MKIYKITQEITSEQQKAIGFWDELQASYPQVDSWRGNPTWDFGNGVKISLTNTPRNVYTDMLYNPIKKNPEDWITVYVENVSSSERGKGYASMAMEKLKQLATKHGIILRLYPKPTEKGKRALNIKQLTDWYKKKGYGEELSHGSHDFKKFPTQKSLYLELGKSSENL